MEKKDLTLDVLATSIRQLHGQLSDSARHAVNVALTLRNWLIGCYIAEYELHGADRATYGEKIVSSLAQRLTDLSNCSRQELYRYISFYRLYPQIVGTVYRQFPEVLMQHSSSSIVGAVYRQLNSQGDATSVRGDIIMHLSYNHFLLLLQVEDATARQFYETECLG